MVQIIVKNYEHVNKAFSNWDTPQGKYVKNKDHYDRLMKEGGYETQDQAIDRNKNRDGKPYILSDKGWAIINAAKNRKDKKGNVKLSDRTIDAMISIGAINKNIPDYMKLPSAYQPKGGFI